jgi:hypothetical protein
MQPRPACAPNVPQPRRGTTKARRNTGPGLGVIGGAPPGTRTPEPLPYYGGGQRVWPLRRLSCTNARIASPHLIAPVILQGRPRGVSSQAPELRERKIGITPFDCLCDKSAKRSILGPAARRWKAPYSWLFACRSCPRLTAGYRRSVPPVCPDILSLQQLLELPQVGGHGVSDAWHGDAPE